MLYPSEGQTQTTPDLNVGTKENIPGPVNFALFPGQICEVRRGHQLRSNEYLRIKIYNEEKARENWTKAVFKNAGTPGAPDTGADSAESVKLKAIPNDLTVGKQYNILGTEVAFYIPPTGVSIVPESDEGGARVFIRQAVTLEQLEYTIKVDEDGNKEYTRGPKVDFPKPTQQFMVARDPKGNILLDDRGNPLRKFKAIEMNALQGIHLKFMTTGELKYADGTKEAYKAGDEKFIKGDKMPIYYPEEGHQLVRYDGKTIHYAVAVTDGEGKYILERESGNVRLVKGPLMLLPDPVKETIAYRALSDRESRVWFPGQDGKGSNEALAWNAKLRQEAGNAPTTRQGVVSDGQLRGGADVMMIADGGAELAYNALLGSPEFGNYGGGRMRSAGPARSTHMQESRQGKDQHAVVGDVAERKSGYNEPRAIIFASKFRGVPTIKVQPGYAINVVKSTGERKAVLGPKTVLLEFSDTLDILRLSTGKPKNTDNLFETVYLNIHNNKVTDVVGAQTSDHIAVTMKLSYNVNFGGDQEKWFTIENYVKHLCDHARSILKGAIRRMTLEEFYASSTDIIRDIILGAKAASKEGAPAARPGLVFKENGMSVTDVEVLGVEIAEKAIGEYVVQSQHAAVKKSLELSLSEKQLKSTLRQEEVTRALADANAITEKHKLLIRGDVLKTTVALALAEAQAEEAKVEAGMKVETTRQALMDLRASAELDRQKDAEEHAFMTSQRQQNLSVELVDAQVNALVKQLGAIQPGLIEALNTVSARETLVKVAGSLSFQQMFGADNGVEFVQKVFAGTPLQGLIESVVAKSANGSAKVFAASAPGQV